MTFFRRISEAVKVPLKPTNEKVEKTRDAKTALIAVVELLVVCCNTVLV